ncbi:MAG: hypothetical protein AB1295_03770 [Candidatus Micrarchaeota archaeon]
MKVNLKKMGAIVAGATILASTAAFAGLMFGSTTLVDDNGAPTAKVVLGGNAAPSDGVSAALIAGKIASEAYKSVELSAEVAGSASCTANGEGSAGTCAISNEKARLEITVPGAHAAGTWTGENLIGDYINRELLDRESNTAGDSDAEYEIGGSDTSENANPFTDGNGGSIGPTETFLYNVDGNQLSSFADFTVVDDDSGNTYVEMQDLWIRGDNRFDSDPDEVVGRLDFLAYTLKFDGPGGDEMGIPECTDSEDNDYAVCKADVGDTTIDDATETHRVKIWFLGEEWIISEMNAPNTATGAELTSENVLVNGGSVKLAKESVSGILNQGESLPVDDLKFQLDDLEAHGDTTSAILSVLDANGNILKKDKVNPGTTKEFNVAGKTYRFHVYKVAPGYTFGAKWADVAIFAEELELVDGQELNEDENNNEGYEVSLGWKNMDAGPDDGDDVDPEPDDPDTLRTIVIYSDSIEDISSSGDEVLEEGDYVSLVMDPEVWKLSYKGLDLTSEDMSSLKFELKTTDKSISESKGPLYNAGPAQSACVIFAPYVSVSSGTSGSTFQTERDDATGDLSDDEFFVALNDGATTSILALADGDPGAGLRAAVCDSDGDGVVEGAISDTALAPGAIFMKVSPSSDDYGVNEYDTVGSLVEYEDVGDGDNDFSPPEGGAIVIEDYLPDINSVLLGGPSDGYIGGLLYSDGYGACLSATCPTFMFGVAEKAGTGSSNEFVDYWVFGVADTDTATPGDATFDFASDDGTLALTSDDQEVLYGHAVANPTDLGIPEGGFYLGTLDSGPVSSGMEIVEENYVSERGSMFKSIDDDTVEFDMAHKLARAQWFLAPASSETDDASKTIVTLGEGESETVSGVTVKVLEITEDVGACGTSGGSVACTADMSGVSAVIMPNNAPTVTAAMPYTGSYGNLVILDSDAVGVNTLISVGGDKVNTVTADLLQGSAVDWTAERKVVREVVQGSKIVVAGRDAADTLEAAQDFVAQVQKV